MARILGRANSEPFEHDSPAASEESQRVKLHALIFDNNLSCRDATVLWRRRLAGDLTYPYTAQKRRRDAGATSERKQIPGLNLIVFHGLAAKRRFRRSRCAGA